MRHPGECNGQSGYGVTKLDGIVDEVIRRKLAQIKQVPKVQLLEEQNGRMVAQMKGKVQQLVEDCEKKEKAIYVHRDYQLDIEFNVSFDVFQKESVLNGANFMTDTHKRGDYSGLRAGEAWKPIPDNHQIPRHEKREQPHS